jgi:hypothetical protein
LMMGDVTGNDLILSTIIINCKTKKSFVGK